MDAKVQCSICWQDCKAEDAKHLALYCNGSEGIIVCLDCRMALTETVRGMMRLAGKCRMAGHRAAKEIAAAKAGTSNVNGQPRPAETTKEVDCDRVPRQMHSASRDDQAR
jgi:hypothetical protein